MSHVVVAEELDSSVEDVWDMVRDFGGIQRWNPGAVRAIEVAGDGVGAVRSITLPGDSVLQEKLESYDEAGRCFSYSIAGDNPLPLSDYVATMKIQPSAGGGSRVEWSSRFEPAGISEEQAAAMVEGIYTGGIAGLRSALASGEERSR